MGGGGWQLPCPSVFSVVKFVGEVRRSAVYYAAGFGATFRDFRVLRGLGFVSNSGLGS